MPFFTVKKVMAQVLKEYNLADDVETCRIFSKWKEIVGERIAEHTNPVRVRERILYVEVDDPIWLAQMKYMKEEILLKIEGMVKGGVIRDIRFFLHHS
jgi:predicted nucleic acid-binding Zn ribbon protein